VPPIIIFVNQKNAVELISKSVETWGFKSISYHGGKSQEAREIAID
jgi:superfamily II DNA/RNA helicase